MISNVILAMLTFAFLPIQLTAQGCQVPLQMNGGFEYGVGNNTNGWFPSGTGGWFTNDQLEIWGNGFNTVPAYQGNNFIELNANNIYPARHEIRQVISTIPGNTYQWQIAHRGRLGVDMATIQFGNGAPIQMVTGPSAWQVYSGSYMATGATTTVLIKAVTIGSAANFLDDFQFMGMDFDCDGYVVGIDCNDEDAGVYPGAPEFCDDVDNDCDGEVDETTLAVYAGDCVSAYYGYAPMDGATLNATVSGGKAPYSYEWSTGETGYSIFVAPLFNTMYSVTVTDQLGCQAVDEVSVGVIDVRCGKNMDKVLVCHLPSGDMSKAKTICISEWDVADHLAHGCFLGSCDQIDPCDEALSRTLVGSGQDDLKVSVLSPDVESGIRMYPNPASSDVFLELPLLSDGDRYEIELLSPDGNRWKNTQIEGGEFQWTIDDMPSGMYFIIIRQGNKLVQTMRLVVAQ